MIMELYGAKDYFDCDRAILMTNGQILSDAQEVADKLRVEIIIFDGGENLLNVNLNNQKLTFDMVWDKYIMPLEGKMIFRNNGKSNKILKVDWGGIKRITSNGKEQFIEIDPFQFAINKMLSGDVVTRDEINQIYPKRASSGIVLILEQIPFVEIASKRPLSIKIELLKKE